MDLDFAESIVKSIVDRWYMKSTNWFDNAYTEVIEMSDYTILRLFLWSII